jgi:hypothetical protein
MFRIRPEHLAAFAQVSLDDFEDRMVEHLGEEFSEKCAALGEAAVRETIRHGVNRAAAYGLEDEYDVCLYLEVMLRLGRDFDKDPRQAWAVPILQDKTRDPLDRAERLWEQVFEPDTEADPDAEE